MPNRPPSNELRQTPDGRLAGPGLLDDPRLRRLLVLLNPEGEETRIVGGAVRNALLGLGPGDVDLATTMRPEAVVRCAKTAKLRAIPTGIEHGTITLMAGDLPVEVTTLREDVETDGRHAVVRFGRDFALDAQRRDFTINALSAAADGRLFDTVGGIADLVAGRVRFIGDAATRIREDFLRILRFFRFHAIYGRGPLDPAGLAAATASRDGIVRLSRERIRSELFKLLAAPAAASVLRAMARTGVLDLVVGAGADTDALAKMAAWDAERPDALLRLAALGLRAAGDPDRLQSRLRLSNAETSRLSAAGEAWSSLSGLPDAAGLRRLLFAHGATASADALRLGHAAGLPPRDASLWQSAAAELKTMARPVLPVSGSDLVRRGLTGPEVGAALTALRSMWADTGFTHDPMAIEAMVEEVARSRRVSSPDGTPASSRSPGSDGG